MKLLILAILAIVSSCTTYRVVKLSKDNYVVSKTTHVLGFWGSSVYNCQNRPTDGRFVLCEETVVEDESERKLKEIQKKAKETEIQRRLMILQSSSEAP